MFALHIKTPKPFYFDPGQTGCVKALYLDAEFLIIRYTFLLISAGLSFRRKILEEILNDLIEHRSSSLRHAGWAAKPTIRFLTISHRTNPPTTSVNCQTGHQHLTLSYGQPQPLIIAALLPLTGTHPPVSKQHDAPSSNNTGSLLRARGRFHQGDGKCCR